MTDPRVSKALELRAEGLGATAIGREIGASHSTVEGWLRTHLHTVCARCGEKLRKPSVECECGFCIEQRTGVLIDSGAAA